MLPMLSEHVSGRSITGAWEAIVHGHVQAAAGGHVDHHLAALLEPRQEHQVGRGIRRRTPVTRFRACTCRMAAPAFAAAMPCSASMSGETGRAGDIVGV